MTCCGCLAFQSAGVMSNQKELVILPEGSQAKGFTDHECGIDFPEGRDEAWAWRLPMKGKVGMANIELETYTQKDRMLFWLDRKLILDTGCIGTSDDTPIAPFTNPRKDVWGCELYIPKGARYLWVEVRPNCAGGSGTRWQLRINCPDGRVALNDKELTKAYRTHNFPDSGNIQHITPIWN